MEATPGTGRHEDGLSRIEGFTDGVVAVRLGLDALHRRDRRGVSPG